MRLNINHGGPLVEPRHTSWRYWGQQFLPSFDLTPLRIALAYTVFGFTALFASDVLLVRYVTEPLLSQLQALKGGVEIVLTAGVIFLLTSAREAQLRQQLHQLNQQREELDVLHRVLRHNLRNDLNIILGYADLLHDNLQSEHLSPKCAEILDTVDDMIQYTDQATRINQIVDNGGLVTYDLTERLPAVIEDHPLLTSDVEVSTTLPECATVEVNPMFEEALHEVLTNAVTHNDTETPRIAIHVDPGSGPSQMVEIRVIDNGPGIPGAERNPLREGETNPLLHLSGLGLWFVTWTVRHSGGTLTIEDNDCGGATVRIQVPKPTESGILSRGRLSGE